MASKICFIVLLLATTGVFIYSVRRLLIPYLHALPGTYTRTGRRLWLLFDWGIMQKRLFRRPLTGIPHALMAWGCMYMVFNSVEMTVDSLLGSQRSFSGLGPLYHFLISNCDIYTYLGILCSIAFLVRRLLMKIGRLDGPEIQKKNRTDGILILTLILIFLVSLAGYNITYILSLTGEMKGSYPLSRLAIHLLNLPSGDVRLLHDLFRWSYLLLLFLMILYLPYSKQFHVFISLPNVYTTRLEPLGKLDKPAVSILPGEYHTPLTRKLFMEAYSCTECGWCTSVCPAHLTGKKLSPRKVMMALREIIRESCLAQNRSGNPEAVRARYIVPLDGETARYIVPVCAAAGTGVTSEELRACTTCMACTRECPAGINPMNIIIEMRREMISGRTSVPSRFSELFANLESFGAPWNVAGLERDGWFKC